MKNVLLIMMILLINSTLQAQSETRIYVFDFKEKGKDFIVTNLTDISPNKGYNNQPSFLPDGSAILFSSAQGDQTEVFKYDLETKKNIRLTNTSGSEYSPTIIPKRNMFSTILLEKDGTQLLYQYPLSGGKGTVLVPELKIGYHAWYDVNTLYSFVLTEPTFTLQKTSLAGMKHQVLGENIGRSLHRIPKSKAMSFIQKSDDQPWQIMRLDTKTGKTTTIINTLEKNEDMAWTPKGTILMSKGLMIYKFNPKKDEKWESLVDLTDIPVTSISRIAVSPKGDKLVIVVTEVK